jgi:Ran-binding protein 3
LFSNALLTNSSLAVDASNNKNEEENDSSISTQPIPVCTSSKDPSSSGGDSNGSNGDVAQTAAAMKNNSSKNNLSLVEAARKYEEMKGTQKRKYEEVEVITGEEDEENILEINCKLYTFENSNYEERGRGTLRLNDTKNSSRVVFRAAGSFRVLLNTKVWGDQLCEKPSSKSMRLTAFCDGLLKIYLVQGRNEDIENLFYELNRRIEKEKSKVEEKPDEHKSKEFEPATKKLSSTDDE